VAGYFYTTRISERGVGAVAYEINAKSANLLLDITTPLFTVPSETLGMLGESGYFLDYVDTSGDLIYLRSSNNTDSVGNLSVKCQPSLVHRFTLALFIFTLDSHAQNPLHAVASPGGLPSFFERATANLYEVVRSEEMDRREHNETSTLSRSLCYEKWPDITFVVPVHISIENGICLCPFLYSLCCVITCILFSNFPAKVNGMTTPLRLFCEHFCYFSRRVQPRSN
jgi:hypothetical protein